MIAAFSGIAAASPAASVLGGTGSVPAETASKKSHR